MDLYSQIGTSRCQREVLFYVATGEIIHLCSFHTHTCFFLFNKARGGAHNLHP